MISQLSLKDIWSYWIRNPQVKNLRVTCKSIPCDSISSDVLYEMVGTKNPQKRQ